MSKPKYYADLTEGKTEGDNLDIYTLHYIGNQIIEGVTKAEEQKEMLPENSWKQYFETGVRDAYVSVTRIITDVLNREIGT